MLDECMVYFLNQTETESRILTAACVLSIITSGNGTFFRIISLSSFALEAQLVTNSATKYNRDILGKQNLRSAYLSSYEIGNSSENEDIMICDQQNKTIPNEQVYRFTKSTILDKNAYLT